MNDSVSDGVSKVIKSVCVYCGSSARVDDLYKDAARNAGRLLAENGMGVIYGGGRVGLMGLTADAALAAGGEVTGIIPAHIADKEIAHEELTALHVVDTMHKRKQMMVDLSDAFVILPGGLGTMDEFFEIFTWWQLGLHDKPVIVVNVGGYWTGLLDLIDHIIDQGFARPADKTHLCVIDDVDGLIAALENAPKETMNPQTKWM